MKTKTNCNQPIKQTWSPGIHFDLNDLLYYKGKLYGSKNKDNVSIREYSACLSATCSIESGSQNPFRQ